MNIYLAIITTALVVTQIIRVTQNAITLHRQNEAIKRDLSWIKDRNITQNDFDIQKECFYLLKEWLEDQVYESKIPVNPEDCKPYYGNLEYYDG